VRAIGTNPWAGRAQRQRRHSDSRRGLLDLAHFAGRSQVDTLRCPRTRADLTRPGDHSRDPGSSARLGHHNATERMTPGEPPANNVTVEPHGRRSGVPTRDSQPVLAAAAVVGGARLPFATLMRQEASDCLYLATVTPGGGVPTCVLNLPAIAGQ
jgi:hypothetical protein